MSMNNEIAELLKAAKCPDPKCDGGVIRLGNPLSGEHIEPCEWCYRSSKALAALQAEPKPTAQLREVVAAEMNRLGYGYHETHAESIATVVLGALQAEPVKVMAEEGIYSYTVNTEGYCTRIWIQDEDGETIETVFEATPQPAKVPEVDDMYEWAKGWREWDYPEGLSGEERIIYGACRSIHSELEAAAPTAREEPRPYWMDHDDNDPLPAAGEGEKP